MRQGLKEWHMMQSVITGGSSDFRDVLPLGESEECIQKETYTWGEGRRLAKNMGR